MTNIYNGPSGKSILHMKFTQSLLVIYVFILVKVFVTDVKKNGQPIDFDMNNIIVTGKSPIVLLKNLTKEEISKEITRGCGSKKISEKHKIRSSPMVLRKKKPIIRDNLPNSEMGEIFVRFIPDEMEISENVESNHIRLQCTSDNETNNSGKIVKRKKLIFERAHHRKALSEKENDPFRMKGNSRITLNRIINNPN